MAKAKNFPITCTGGLFTTMNSRQQATELPGSARELENLYPDKFGGYKQVQGFETKSSYTHRANKPAWIIDGFTAGSTSIKIAGLNPSVGTIFVIGYSSSVSFVSYNKQQYEVLSSTVTDSGNSEYLITFTPAITSSDANLSPLFVSLNSTFEAPVIVDNCIISLSSGNIDYVRTGMNSIYRLRHENGDPSVTGTGTTVIGGVTYDTITITGLKNKIFANQRIDFVRGTLASSHRVVQDEAVDATGTCTVAVYGSISSDFATNFASYYVFFADFTGTYPVSRLGNPHYTTFYATDDQGTLLRKIILKHPIVPNLMLDITLDPDNLFTNNYYNVIEYPDLGYGTNNIGSDWATIEYHKNQLFYSNGKALLSFTAPYDYKDTSAANGAGSINLPDQILRILSFRDELLIFCSKSIYKITGNTGADFRLSLVSDSVYCVDSGSIQKFNNDVVFLSNVGFVTIGTVISQGGSNISISTSVEDIVSEYLNLAVFSASYSSGVFGGYGVSYVTPSGDQYRYFPFNSTSYYYDDSVALDGYPNYNAYGLGLVQNQGRNEWFQIHRLPVSSASTFTDLSGKIYTMFFRYNDPHLHYIAVDAQVAGSFGDDPIICRYSTPALEFDDASLIKTVHRVSLSVPFGSGTVSYRVFEVPFEGTVNVYYDYGNPKPYELLNSYYDTTNLTATGKKISLVFDFKDSDGFRIDGLDIEYMLHDRR